MIAAVADVFDIVILGTARHFTQQTLTLCTDNTPTYTTTKYILQVRDASEDNHSTELTLLLQFVHYTL